MNRQIDTFSTHGRPAGRDNVDGAQRQSMRRGEVRRWVTGLAWVIGAMNAAGVPYSVAEEPAKTPPEPEFSYGRDAPAKWAEVPGWEACGRRPTSHESPIDITASIADASLQPLDLDLRPARLHLINNGHTIEHPYAGSGSRLTVDGRDFNLKQFHFHTVSEHTVEGEHARLEMHAVFLREDAQTPPIGAVVSVRFVQGADDPFLASLMKVGMPAQEGESFRGDASELTNLADALTDTARYYNYSGALTTPPCTEGIDWFVLAETRTISDGQYAAFHDIMGDNFRPVQPLHDRTIRRAGF